LPNGIEDDFGLSVVFSLERVELAASASFVVSILRSLTNARMMAMLT